MIDINWLTVLMAVVFPMLVGLATNRLADPGTKAIVLAVLSAVGGVLNELYQANGVLEGFDWSTAGSSAVTVFLLAVGAHFGLLKPLSVTGANGQIQVSAPSGLGAPKDSDRF